MSRLSALLALGVAALLPSGCGGEKSCAKMGAMSDVLSRAALVRLDVFDGSAHCAGDTLAPGAPAPLASKTAPPGAPLTLDVSPGHRVLVLYAFADAMMTKLIGVACTETDLKAAQPACLDLTLDRVSDFSTAMSDLGSRSDLASTDLACADVTSDPSNCGACGRACSSAGVMTPACSNKICAPVCSAGAGDCKHPVAPNPDDGCETNFYDVANCGGCGNRCTLANATPGCPQGTCSVASCASGFFDCDGKAANGCECAGVDLGLGAGGCCGSGCQAGHNDGFGHSFSDCIAKGTYNEQLARDAARAYDPTLTPFGNTCPNGTTKVICAMSSSACACWAYDDTATTNPATGRARRDSSSTCHCPNIGDQPWG